MEAIYYVIVYIVSWIGVVLLDRYKTSKCGVGFATVPTTTLPIINTVIFIVALFSELCIKEAIVLD